MDIFLRLSLTVVCGFLAVIITLPPNAKAQSDVRITDCPSYTNYSPQQAVKIANQLIVMGEADAYATLKKMTLVTLQTNEYKGFIEKYPNTEKIAILATLLYRSESKNTLRPPRIASCNLLPCDVFSEKDWLHLPIEFVDDIPLLMACCIVAFNLPEPADSYLEYCKANGTFRTRIYWTPSDQEVNEAMEKLFSLDKWKALKMEDSKPSCSYNITPASDDWLKSRVRSINLRSERKQPR